MVTKCQGCKEAAYLGSMHHEQGPGPGRVDGGRYTASKWGEAVETVVPMSAGAAEKTQQLPVRNTVLDSRNEARPRGQRSHQ